MLKYTIGLFIFTLLPAVAYAEEPAHFQLLHTTKIDKSTTIKEVIDRDTVQHYLVFENSDQMFVIYKEPPQFRRFDECIDSTTGKLCANPLIKNPYGMNNYFVDAPVATEKTKEEKTK